MSAKVDQFCDALRDRLTAMENCVETFKSASNPSRPRPRRTSARPATMRTAGLMPPSPARMPTSSVAERRGLKCRYKPERESIASPIAL